MAIQEGTFLLCARKRGRSLTEIILMRSRTDKIPMILRFSVTTK